MTLSEKEQRILREIEHRLAFNDPHLNRALRTGWPSLPHRQVLAAGVLASLLTGIALLISGLMLNMLALAWAGIPLVQFGPAAIVLTYRKRRKRRASHENVQAAHRKLDQKPYWEGA